MTKYTSSILLIVAAGVARGQTHQEHGPAAPKIVLGGEELRLPFSLMRGKLLVEAGVNGKGPYRFWFDTGASGSVISQSLARELGLKSVGQVAVRGGSGPNLSGELVTVDEIALGTAKLSGVTLVAMDLSRVGVQDAPVGVLSPVLFPGHLVSIDYAKRIIRIRPGELPAPDDKTVFAYLKGHLLPSVKLNVAGQDIEAHLDSGSSGALSLPKRYADKLQLAGPLVDLKKPARTVAGEYPVFEGQLKGRITFGQFTFDEPTIHFSEAIEHGNVGGKILERYVVTVDTKNRRFRLDEGDPDGEAIRRAALDYAEGWYEGDAAKMERALHPDLAKRIVAGDGKLEHMTAAALIDAVRRGGGKANASGPRIKDVTILDATDKSAAVKVVMRDFVDYLHLAKVNDRWVIVNVLWEMRPKSKA